MGASKMAGEQHLDKSPQNGATAEVDDGDPSHKSGARSSPVTPRRESTTMRKARVDARGEIMTRNEVAELLRCSEPHVVALIEREGLPAFRLGKLWRFRRSEVLAWCQRRENGSRTA
jgi:excisionase family DNA binding protein